MINYNNIIKEDNKDLFEKSVEVKLPLSAEDEKTMLDLHDYLQKSYDENPWEKYKIKPGVGLAAPQIDCLRRMFAILTYDENGELYELGVINPKIIAESEALTYLDGGEGCLSVDRSVTGFVHRPKRIKVVFHSYDFETHTVQKVTMRLKNYLAVVFQHEFDHLNGVLFVDHINKEIPFFVPKNSSVVKFRED